MVASGTTDEVPFSKSTTRVVSVIDALIRAADGGVGVRELAGQLGISRSATHRILANLAELKVARPLESGRYEMSARVSSWAYFLEQHPLLDAARPIMDKLARAAGEGVHMLLITEDRQAGTYVASAAGPSPVQYDVRLGRRQSLTAGAAAKAALAAMSEVESNSIVDDLRTSDPQHADRLSAELPTIRAQGYAASQGELIPEAAGIAAAFEYLGVAAGAMTISMPSYRRDPSREQERIELVLAAAAELTAALHS